MKIRIGVKEIYIPAFISNASEGDQELFKVFLVEVLSAQSEKIRNKVDMENYKKGKQEQAINDMLGNPLDNLKRMLGL